MAEASESAAGSAAGLGRRGAFAGGADALIFFQEWWPEWRRLRRQAHLPAPAQEAAMQKEHTTAARTPASSAGVSTLRLLGRGLLASLLLALVLLGQQLLLGRSPFAEPGEWVDVWVALVHCLGAG